MLLTVLFLSFYSGANKKKEKVPKRKKNQRYQLEFVRILVRKFSGTRPQKFASKIQQFYANSGNFVAICAFCAYKPAACENYGLVRHFNQNFICTGGLQFVFTLFRGVNSPSIV